MTTRPPGRPPGRPRGRPPKARTTPATQGGSTPPESGAPQLVYLDPRLIHEPDQRITTQYKPGQAEMLAQSLKVEGQVQPCLVMEIADERYIVDGLNRLREAIARGDDSIPCILIFGDARGLALKNLTTATLHGFVKPVDVANQLLSLFEVHGMTIPELVATTGHSQGWVEQMLLVGQAPPPVLDALDEELITMGHAHVLAKVEDEEVQSKALHNCLVHRWTVKELEEWIAAQFTPVVSEDNGGPASRGPGAGRNPNACSFCHTEKEPDQVQTLFVCTDCSDRATQAQKGPPLEMVRVIEDLADRLESHEPDGELVARARQLLATHQEVSQP